MLVLAALAAGRSELSQSLALMIERIGQKLARYHARIDECREEGLFTRDYTKVEHAIRRVWKLQRKARSAMKRLPATERQDVAAAYNELHRQGELAVQQLLALRADLLYSNVSPTLRVRAVGAEEAAVFTPHRPRAAE